MFDESRLIPNDNLIVNFGSHIPECAGLGVATLG